MPVTPVYYYCSPARALTQASSLSHGQPRHETRTPSRCHCHSRWHSGWQLRLGVQLGVTAPESEPDSRRPAGSQLPVTDSELTRSHWQSQAGQLCVQVQTPQVERIRKVEFPTQTVFIKLIGTLLSISNKNSFGASRGSLFRVASNFFGLKSLLHHRCLLGGRSLWRRSSILSNQKNHKEGETKER